MCRNAKVGFGAEHLPQQQKTKRSYMMIEKLPEIQIHSCAKINEKLNEVIDAVNKLETMAKNTNTVLESLVEENNIHEKQIDELQMKVEPEDKGYIKLDNDSLQKFLKAHPEYNNKGVIEIPKKEPADPYAEQRKWIGKVCWFWDEEEEEKIFGILTTIDSDCGLSDMCPYWNGTTSNWFEHCEPVKPTDSIIYKGGDNE